MASSEPGGAEPTGPVDLQTLAANASGAVKSRMTVLITPEEVDHATERTVKFRPPGK